MLANVVLGAHKSIDFFAGIATQKRHSDRAIPLIEQAELTAGAFPPEDALKIR